jgi:nitroreductase
LLASSLTILTSLFGYPSAHQLHHRARNGWFERSTPHTLRVPTHRRFQAAPEYPDFNALPNQALQLTDHSAFQSIHGRFWRLTGRSGLPGQRAGRPAVERPYVIQPMAMKTSRTKEEEMKNSETKFEPLKFQEKNPEEMIAISESFYLDMKKRRTVREFSDRPIPDEVIKNALRAAGTAPSGANMQPWYFVVVSNPEMKREIRKAAEEEEKAFYQSRAPEEWLSALEPLGTDEDKPFLETAPCLIVVFLKKTTVDEEGKEHKNYYITESVGIATGILITALHLSGLATLPYTPSPMKFLNKILGRPDNERPILILVTGYPNSNAKVPVISKYHLDQIASFE